MSVTSLGQGGRQTERSFARPAYMSHQVTMPYQPLHRSHANRRQSFLSFVYGSAVRRRQQERRRSSASTLCRYIAAVVLLQNALMAYNLARRASVGVAAMTDQTTANGTLKEQSIATAANSHASDRKRVMPETQSSRSAGYETSGSQDIKFEEVAFEKFPKDERMYYRKRAIKVNPYKHQLLLVPSQLCDTDTVMIVIVHSGTNNVAQRAAIRETWGDAATTGRWPGGGLQDRSCSGLRLAFVLGLHADQTVNRAVREEHARHNDIIQGDFVDDYRNMTLKSLLDLKAVDERCPGVRYLLKTDDDMIVNLPYLLRLLATKNLQRSIMGPINVGARAHRGGKWKLTQQEFPFVLFPPYESGSAYVITGDLIHELFVTAEYVPHIFIDDVYVTGILGRILGVNHVMHRGFAFWHSRAPSVCDIVSNRVVSGTKMTPARLRDIWKQLRNPTCPVSYRLLQQIDKRVIILSIINNVLI